MPLAGRDMKPHIGLTAHESPVPPWGRSRFRLWCRNRRPVRSGDEEDFGHLPALGGSVYFIEGGSAAVASACQATSLIILSITVRAMNSDSTTIWAARHVSGLGSLPSGIRIAFIPAATAARMPGSESSSTMQCAGRWPRREAAIKNTSGSGLPWLTWSPPTTTSQWRNTPA